MTEEIKKTIDKIMYGVYLLFDHGFIDMRQKLLLTDLLAFSLANKRRISMKKIRSLVNKL